VRLIAKKKKVAGRRRTNSVRVASPRKTVNTDSFAVVVEMIEAARAKAYQAVNKELVGLYWRIGQYISRKLARAQWGDSVVDELAKHLAQKMPGLRGFTRRNLFRMCQFYETYAAEKKVSPLVTQLPWTHNLLILSQCKRSEEREFYLRRSALERKRTPQAGYGLRRGWISAED
jgi:predicted nuclease of restriction endonuclease-like (RecB) superfamily